jgi:hypothetical protein
VEGGAYWYWHRDGLLRVVGCRFSVSDGTYRVTSSMFWALLFAILVKDRNGRGFIKFPQGAGSPQESM